MARTEEHIGSEPAGDPATHEDPSLDEAFSEVFREAVEALHEAEVPFLVMGGISSTIHGRERWTHDIDLFTRQRHARWALGVLAERGFDTEETFWDWL